MAQLRNYLLVKIDYYTLVVVQIDITGPCYYQFKMHVAIIIPIPHFATIATKNI